MKPAPFVYVAPRSLDGAVDALAPLGVTELSPPPHAEKLWRRSWPEVPASRIRRQSEVPDRQLTFRQTS